MKLENMNQEFPKMPDAMRKMIEQEVAQQLQKKTSKFTGRRVMIAVLAATLALGTTAFAGVLYRMKSKQVGRREPLCEADCGVAAGRNGADRGRKI